MKYLIVVLALSVIGCATHVSPVADIANAGAKIEQSGNAIFKATIASAAPQKAKDDVAIAVNKLGHVGLDFGAALRAYNQAKASGTDVVVQKSAVMAVLTVVQKAMDDVGKALPPGTLQTVDGLVNQVLDIVAQVKLQVAL